jgi:hypothetical protein
MQTVETNFRVPVHHFATVDFNGFVKIIDAIGGITVEVPYTLKDDAYPTDDGSNYTRFLIPAGLQHMDGLTALRYARSRNFDTDFGRQRRQQQVLQTMREQGVKLDLAPRLPEFIALLSGSVKTDLDPRQLPGLVSLGMSIERDNIKSYGITAEMLTVRETPDIYYLEPAWPRINAALREMLGGAPRSEPNTVAPTPRPRVGATARPPEPPTPTPRPAATPTTRAATAVARTPAEPTATRLAAAATRTVVPDRARVWVRNGTRVQGLAARAAEVLRSRGYAIVDVTQDPDAGKYPQSVVFVYGVERRDGVVLAQVLGLPAGAVRLGPAPAPPGTDILVILGDDAPRT